MNTDHLVLRTYKGSDMKELFLKAMAESEEKSPPPRTASLAKADPYLVEVCQEDEANRLFTRFRMVDKRDHIEKVMKKWEKANKATGKSRGTTNKMTKAEYLRAMNAFYKDGELSNAIALAEIAGIDLAYRVDGQGTPILYQILEDDCQVGQPTPYKLAVCKELGGNRFVIMYVAFGLLIKTGDKGGKLDSLIKETKRVLSTIPHEQFHRKVEEYPSKVSQETLKQKALTYK